MKRRGQWVLAHFSEGYTPFWLNLDHVVLMARTPDDETRIVYADDDEAFIFEIPEALLEQLGGDE